MEMRNVGGAAGEREGKMKRITFVTYIRRVVPISHMPPIFVGEATSPMNICHVYSSVTWRTDEYMGQIKVKSDGLKICRCHPYILRPD
jgi:hypothetical protein